MAQVNVTLTESPAANTGVSTNVGQLFAAGATDQGPSTPVLLQSLTQYVNTYGPRSTVSAAMYDTAEAFFTRKGAAAYFLRVTDNTATSAVLTLLDGSGHPTVTLTALTPGVDGNSIYASVANGNLLIETSSGTLLESWPFSGSNAQLLGIASAYVIATQATGSGNTTAVPTTLSLTALSGGADASDLTASSYANALAGFGPQLGPGTVCLPGQTSSTCVVALFTHAFNNNRFAVAEQADAATSASAVTALTALAIPSAYQKCGIVVQGRPIVPFTGGSTKTIPASGVVAALRAQVAASGGNAPPAFAANGAVTNVIGFTTAYAQNPTIGTSWGQQDVNVMADAGLCFWGWDPVPCLDEFVTPAITDNIFFEGTAWVACMMLVSQAQAVGQQFKGAVIDGQGLTISAFHGLLASIVQNLFANNVIYGDVPSDAASIVTSTPVNTPATAQAGTLNAQIAARLAPYADQVNIAIDVVSLTQSVGASS